jgi:ribosomal protein S18 acetylase RimI-like enzyme
MTVRIIRYASQYQAAVIELWIQCILLVPWNDPVEDIQKKVAFQPDLFFVAVRDGQVVGSIMVGYDGHRGWINYLAVLPRFQKRGYGRKLLATALSELKRLNCVKVNLQVRANNAALVAFYQHLGFQVEDRISMGLRLR